MIVVAPSRGTDRQARARLPNSFARSQLVRAAIELGAPDWGGPLSQAEQNLIHRYSARKLPASLDIGLLRSIAASPSDPLGETWLAALGLVHRRTHGSIYTPHPIVRTMIRWVASSRLQRVVDMGCGSGRFTIEAARRCPDAEIVAVDSDPVATVLTRARLACLGLERVRVIHKNYLDLELDSTDGATAFVGNPPYVRHHRLSSSGKAKAARIAARLGCRLSGLSGLHVHFLLATAMMAVDGDVGCVVTSAEWLQVNYGQPLRDLLVSQLGLEIMHILDPALMVFPDTMTTAAIIGFRVGSRRPSVSVTVHSEPETFGRNNGTSRALTRESLAGVRWRFLLSDSADHRTEPSQSTTLTLGNLFRVHRGIATGANDFFAMTRDRAAERGLLPWVRPVLTAAEDVLKSNGELRGADTEMVLLSPPADLDLRASTARPLLDYLRFGQRHKVHLRYLCSHRRPWWFLGRLSVPDVVATYMTRKPPAFALNPDGLLALNVIHGLFPIRPTTRSHLVAVVRYLNGASLGSYGRVYQGGLQKFEPRELEAVPIPSLEEMLGAPLTSRPS